MEGARTHLHSHCHRDNVDIVSKLASKLFSLNDSIGLSKMFFSVSIMRMSFIGQVCLHIQGICYRDIIYI